MQGDFDLSSLSTLVWAFAAFDLYDEPLLTAVAKKASRRIRHFTPEQLSRVRKEGKEGDREGRAGREDGKGPLLTAVVK